MRSFELKIDSGILQEEVCRWMSTQGGIQPISCSQQLKSWRWLSIRWKQKTSCTMIRFYEFENGAKRVGPPQLRDWNAIEKLCWFLIIFYNSILVVSASTSLNSHRCYGEIVTIATNLVLSSSSDSDMRSKATKMLKKFERYWNGLKNINMILIVVTVFDPRNKLELAKICFEDLYGLENTKYKEMYWNWNKISLGSFVILVCYPKIDNKSVVHLLQQLDIAVFRTYMYLDISDWLLYKVKHKQKKY